jgi:hypothetical protein
VAERHVFCLEFKRKQERGEVYFFQDFLFLFHLGKRKRIKINGRIVWERETYKQGVTSNKTHAPFKAVASFSGRQLGAFFCSLGI